MANKTVTVLEADGTTETDIVSLDVGRQAAAASKSLATCTEDKAVLDAIAASLSVLDDWDSSDRARIAMASGDVASGAYASGAFATGSMVDLGVAGDAASATGTISAKLRGIATALGITALDLGSGTGGSRTLRFFKDTAQWIGGSGANGTAVQRVTVATDDTIIASLATKLDTLITNTADESGGNLDDINTATTAAAASLAALETDNIEAGTSGTPSVDVVSMQGTVAHDSAATMAPVLGGMKAVAHGANPTAVTAGDASYWYCNRAGVPFVIGGHPNIITRSCRISATQTDNDLIGAVGSGTKIALTQVSVVVGQDSQSTLTVALGFGTANTPTPSATGVAGMVVEGEFAAGAGIQKGNGSAVIAVGGDGEELRLTSDDPGTGNLFVTFSYFTIES